MWLSILKAFATGYRELFFLKAHIHGIIGANLLDSQAMSNQEKSLFQQMSDRKAEKLDVMKGLMQALKDNQALRLAVITGSFTIPSMPVLLSLRQSTRRILEIWRARAMRHCSRLMIECT